MARVYGCVVSDDTAEAFEEKLNGVPATDALSYIVEKVADGEIKFEMQMEQKEPSYILRKGGV